MPNRASEWIRGRRAERPRFKRIAYVNNHGGVTFTWWFLLLRRGRLDPARAAEAFRWGLEQLEEFPSSPLRSVRGSGAEQV